MAGRQLHRHDESHSEIVPSGPEPVQVQDRPIEDTTALDGDMDGKRTTGSLAKGKDRVDNRDGETHEKAESAGSPMECQERLLPAVDMVAMRSSEVAVTQPYLPAIPRYEVKPRFSVAYEGEASLFGQVALIESSR